MKKIACAMLVLAGCYTVPAQPDGGGDAAVVGICEASDGGTCEPGAPVSWACNVGGRHYRFCAVDDAVFTTEVLIAHCRGICGSEPVCDLAVTVTRCE